jgi:hypothetical protein
LGNFGNVAILAASRKELEEVLEEGDKFVLALAVGQEEGEEYREVAGLQEDLLGEVSGELAGEDRALVDILKRG